MRVLYVQYANPAAYPPLVHSIALLSDAGCEIRVVGLATMADDLGSPYPNDVRTRLLADEAPGWRQKVHYARFAWTVVRECAAFRPDWIYASDALSAPIVALVRTFRSVRVLYHEHDAPVLPDEGQQPTRFTRAVLRARASVTRRADVCVVPNRERAMLLDRGPGSSNPQIVWNCPRRADAVNVRPRSQETPVRFLYQGSIVPARLPLAVIDAFRLIDERAQLVIAGYETIGHPGYVRTLLDRAASAGIANRVTYTGVLNRARHLSRTASCDVGLSLFPLATLDPNESTMVGASNKAFEYLAKGLALVVSDRPEWRRAFVETGFARPCDPSSAASIAEACQWYLDRPDDRRAMGERGRRRILEEWNYDAMFQPVLTRMLAALAAKDGRHRARAAVQA
jgi:glycosyltransferase involved in cell wall biosynthesis